MFRNRVFSDRWNGLMVGIAKAIRAMRHRAGASRPAALLAAALILLSNVQTALADSTGAWPSLDAPFSRGPGGYLSPVKIILCWLLFLLWVRTTDFVSQDCQRMRLNYVVWNSVVFFTFVAAFILLWMIPLFAIGFVLLLMAYIGPLTAYIMYRNSTVTAERRILTPDHLKHVWEDRIKQIGVKVDPEKKKAKREGPPVQFIGKGGQTDRENTANVLLAKQNPGWPAARELIADMIEHRADSAMLDFTQAEVTVRYQIDGVWHNYESRDRESGDAMLTVLKQVAALKPAERKAKQEGAFAAEFKGLKKNCRIASQGVPTGERVVLNMADTVDRMWTMEELGMRNKVEEQLNEVLNRSKGIVLFTSLPAGGLTTTLDTAVRSLDRFMRDVVAIEDAAHREHEIQNVQIMTFNSAGGETAITALGKAIRSYPNVLIVRDLPDANTVEFLCDQVGSDRLVVSGIRAKESAEALLRVLMLKIPAKTFAPAVSGVLHQRLIRKLCDKCKEAYAPSAELLKQLGIPAGRVQAFYRPPSPQPGQQAPPPCDDCLNVGYKGRTAIFELMVVDDGVRQALVNTPKVDAIRTAARKAGMRTLQEEGIVLVVKGTTSLAELQRVLKEGTQTKG
jgi:type II secretory ATPase GspE/PulE/Tfp pilus assembly ATPase PilB-like protein